MLKRKKLKTCLDSLAETYGADYIDSDPIGLVHNFDDPLDIEIAGFIAAILAYGGAGQIRNSIGDALDRLDNAPSECVRNTKREDLKRRFAGFKHRWTTGNDMAYILAETASLISEYGGIGGFVKTVDSAGDNTIEQAMIRFSETLTGNYGSDHSTGNERGGISYLVPSPKNGSACKRSAMYFRWMVRPGPVDFGLWDYIDPARLVIPVDRHIARMGRLLGLTGRTTPGWKMAIEITNSLKKLDPDDPLRYDFALVRPGILRECGERGKGDCSGCILNEVCGEAECV